MYHSRFLVFSLVTALLLLMSFATAQTIELENPLKYNTFKELVDAIINLIYTIALYVAPILIVIAGFIFITSGGDPKGLQRAKDILIYTAVGFFVILLSKGLIMMILDIFGR